MELTTTTTKLNKLGDTTIITMVITTMIQEFIEDLIDSNDLEEFVSYKNQYV